jgi:hypothetical protein
MLDLHDGIDAGEAQTYNQGIAAGGACASLGAVAERTRVDPWNLTQGNACVGKQPQFGVLPNCQAAAAQPPSARPHRVARAFRFKRNDPSREEQTL